MSIIEINNLNSKEAFELLKNVQKNHAPSYAIQGKRTHRFIHTDTVTAEVKIPDTPEGLDFNNCTFKISSGYWVESSLREFLY